MNLLIPRVRNNPLLHVEVLTPNSGVRELLHLFSRRRRSTSAAVRGDPQEAGVGELRCGTLGGSIYSIYVLQINSAASWIPGPLFNSFLNVHTLSFHLGLVLLRVSPPSSQEGENHAPRMSFSRRASILFGMRCLDLSQA